MKVAILAGGLGTRIREETEFRPKPMVMVGNRPLIWHIMKTYSHFGYKNFVVCAGYRGEMIREYFLDFASKVSDFTVQLGMDKTVVYHDEIYERDWSVTVADTGQLTMTGGRLFRARKYLDGDVFMCTYGDGLADVNINSILDFHKSHGKVATVTAIKPVSRFGVLETHQDGKVLSFKEKPQVDGWVNAGFFVFNKEIFEYLSEFSVLENEPLMNLSRDGQLMAFRHEGFWQPMDTYRELTILNDLWESEKAPWRVWR